MMRRHMKYFPGVLILELYRTGQHLWTLASPLRYYPAGKLRDTVHEVIVVPSGTKTDLASTGFLKGFLLAATETAWAAIVHDYLYQTQKHRRRTADHVLYQAMLDSGCPRRWAYIYWLAVRVFGYSAWRSHRKDKP